MTRGSLVSLGEFGTQVFPSATPTITAGAYTAKDAVGGRLEFANAVRAEIRTGIVLKVVIVDKAAQNAELVLFLFDRPFTATADNAAFDPTDADLANCVGVITINAFNYVSANDNSVATKECVLDFSLTGTTLYGQLMCTGTPTYASTSDLKIALGILQD